MVLSTGNNIRVLLVDGHTVVRTGLRMLIESFPGMEVVGDAATREEAVSAAAEVQPDVILIDINNGHESELELVPELLEVTQETKIILLTTGHNQEVHQQGVRLGAMGLVHKEQTADILQRAIEKVHAGEIWLNRSLTATILSQMSRSHISVAQDPEAEKIAKLTTREREVITLIGEGLKNKQIGSQLSISPTTVRHHLTSIFSKLEVADRLELIIYAYRHGLAAPPF